MRWSPHRRARAHRKVVAMEVELSAEVTDRDVRHLLWLRERLGADFLGRCGASRVARSPTVGETESPWCGSVREGLAPDSLRTEQLASLTSPT